MEEIRKIIKVYTNNSIPLIWLDLLCFYHRRGREKDFSQKLKIMNIVVVVINIIIIIIAAVTIKLSVLSLHDTL